mmetsp:Transcript_33116/g.72140  ORF Transcript_33116/g.72140 Transcript_33116/m.72140 type:complete len:272 (+) Transcript_33116:421-1236(+)
MWRQQRWQEASRCLRHPRERPRRASESAWPNRSAAFGGDVGGGHSPAAMRGIAVLGLLGMHSSGACGHLRIQRGLLGCCFQVQNRIVHLVYTQFDRGRDLEECGPVHLLLQLEGHVVPAGSKEHSRLRWRHVRHHLLQFLPRDRARSVHLCKNRIDLLILNPLPHVPDALPHLRQEKEDGVCRVNPLPDLIVDVQDDGEHHIQHDENDEQEEGPNPHRSGKEMFLRKNFPLELVFHDDPEAGAHRRLECGKLLKAPAEEQVAANDVRDEGG